ncbi:MAG: low molecular weight protein-tyrosine-phosphatase [Planctomycetota bacterium]
MAKRPRRSVLFVCMGNICRSPTGEGVFKALVDERGLSDQIEVDSAGTIGYHTGNPADSRMCRAAQRRGVSLDSRARQVTRQDLSTFDLVIAMDRANYDDLIALGPDPEEHEKIRMLGEFLPAHVGSNPGPYGVPDVPDPYYGGPDGFEEVLDMVESACPAILDALLHPNGES